MSKIWHKGCSFHATVKDTKTNDLIQCMTCLQGNRMGNQDNHISTENILQATGLNIFSLKVL